MKGGYQIIDLSKVGTTATNIPGAFDAFKGANGKPVLIITPDGNEVFAKVKEGVLNTFGASYTDGESVYLVEVDSDSNVLIQEIEIGGGGSSSYIIGPFVLNLPITTEGSYATLEYTPQSDGYLCIENNSRLISGSYFVSLIDTTNNRSVYLRAKDFNDEMPLRNDSYFVHNGLKIKIEAPAGLIDTAHFSPVTPA